MANPQFESSDTSLMAFKGALLESLQIVGNGSFTSIGPLPDIHPGLYVYGLGKIDPPLPERDTVELSRVCHEAQLGKGSETFVDPNVRKAWEINADHVRFRNPQCPSVVDQAVSKVTEGLGVIGGGTTVRAELYKLLLYEPGAFFLNPVASKTF